MITGAAGFLGTSVVQQFRETDFDVVGVARSSHRNSGFMEIDFSDGEAINVLDSLSDIDVIIHLASHVDFSRQASMDDFRATNHDAVIALTDLARKNQSHIVFVSGSLVCGEKTFIGANSEISPELPYAKAKRSAERLFGEYLGPLTILRPCGIFGYPGPRHLGINTAIAEAIETRRLPTCYGAGGARRNYIFVEDLARAIRFVVVNGIVGTHFVSGSERLTIFEMLELISKTFIDGDAAVVQMRAGGVSRDMIVEPSETLPETRTFFEALLEIRESLNVNKVEISSL